MTLQQQLEAIRKLDPKAAEYIETVVIPRYGGKDISNREIVDLFIFCKTPQGGKYWYDIWKRLNNGN